LASPQKVTKKSRQALIAPRILPANATGTLRYHSPYIGHNIFYNFYQCPDRVDSLHYSYNQESAEHSLACWEHHAAGAEESCNYSMIGVHSKSSSLIVSEWWKKCWNGEQQNNWNE